MSELEAWLSFDWQCINLRRLQGNTLERLLFDPFSPNNQVASRDLDCSLKDPLGILDGLWRHKSGLQLSPHVRIGSLRSADQVANLPASISMHMFSKWTCPSCNIEILVNSIGVKEHLATCSVILSKQASNHINSSIEMSFQSDKQHREQQILNDGVKRGERTKKKHRRIGTSVKGTR
mmetsp:Transcript_39888/g.51417  ORF Transcript_39888/g.51417 Transcript_39888/m.51417 type:complete len:178 (+) Transcript_39888:729-1262(+)